jgi:hypothetical protein
MSRHGREKINSSKCSTFLYLSNEVKPEFLWISDSFPASCIDTIIIGRFVLSLCEKGIFMAWSLPNKHKKYSFSLTSKFYLEWFRTFFMIIDDDVYWTLNSKRKLACEKKCCDWPH